MKHRVDDKVFHCMQCGKSLLDIFDDKHYECEGIHGYIHLDFVRTLLQYIKIVADHRYGKQKAK
jgi:hypothetical protein